MSGKATKREFKVGNGSESIGLVICVTLLVATFLSVPTSNSHAAITGSGDITPANPSAWILSTHIFIGKTTTGSVTVNGGSELKSSGGILGYNPGSNGTVTITGTGSTWSYVGIPFSDYYDNTQMYIGYFASGTINILAGGKIFNNNNKVSYLGYKSGSSGTIIVNGNGSSLANDEIYVGHSGTGTLNIEAGGQVSTGGGYLGFSSGSTGTATVTGTGSKWTTGVLYLDKDGNGTLTVADGGTVNVNNGLYGSMSDLYGNGTVSTNGGVLDANLIFNVAHGSQNTISFGTGGTLYFNQAESYVLGTGYKGNGTLVIAEGLTVPSYKGYLGYYSGSCGTATVTGIGSKWTNNSELYIGYSGNGSLSIEAGGQVSNGIYASFSQNSYVGYNAGASGAVTVTGTNSEWNNRNSLYIGYSGMGTLNIGGGSSIGGLVTATKVILANSNSGTGTCNINNDGLLQVGNITKGSGTANFNWSDGTIQNYDASTDLTIANSLVLKLAASGTHAFNIDLNRTGTINAVLTDATSGGTLNKRGAGALTLTGANTYSGQTMVEEGLFKVTGSILNTSGVTVRDTAILELARASGDATASTLAIDNDGTVLISAGSPKVGAISGSGITQVNAGASITANSIAQDMLVIGAKGVQTIPEPSALAMLLTLAIGGLLWWRRRSLVPTASTCGSATCWCSSAWPT